MLCNSHKGTRSSLAHMNTPDRASLKAGTPHRHSILHYPYCFWVQAQKTTRDCTFWFTTGFTHPENPEQIPFHTKLTRNEGLGGLRSPDLAVRNRSHYPCCATSPAHHCTAGIKIQISPQVIPLPPTKTHQISCILVGSCLWFRHQTKHHKQTHTAFIPVLWLKYH